MAHKNMKSSIKTTWRGVLLQKIIMGETMDVQRLLEGFQVYSDTYSDTDPELSSWGCINIGEG